MQDKNYYEQLEKLFEQKYSGFVEIYRLTKELDDVLRSNDKDSVKIVMKMRGEEMERINVLNEKIEEICRFLPSQEAAFLKQEPKDDFCPEGLQKIMTIRKRNQRALEKIIEIDRAFCNRIGGRKSFYGGR